MKNEQAPESGIKRETENEWMYEIKEKKRISGRSLSVSLGRQGTQKTPKDTTRGQG